MISLIHDYPSEFEPRLNSGLMTKDFDAPLVDYIVDSWRSLEVVPNIKFIGYEFDTNEYDIDVNRYIFKREKKKKKKDKKDYKFIADDRFGKLTVHLEVHLMEKNEHTGEMYKHVYPVKKEMLIPIQDEKGYYYIHGKKYYLIYQMVEKSTYTSNQSVTLKSLMPVAVKRGILESTGINEIEVKDNTDDTPLTDEKMESDNVSIEDCYGKQYTLPYYNVFVFKKEVPAILFYLKDGFNSAMDFLGVSGAIELLEKLPEIHEPDTIYFPISNKCFLSVNRTLFDKYIYLQSVVGGILHVCNNRTTVASFDDPKVWIKKISGTNNYEKGESTLNFLGRLLDETTKKIVKTHPYHRQDIYTVLRWMCQEFTFLRTKDNLSLKNKRLRCNEVISSLLTLEFSSRLNRIISLGEKATIDNYREFFRFSGDILIQKMHNSGILRFDEAVNDMTFFSKFKFTNKGPHSLGGKNSNNIGLKYRGIHPSFLGNLDILVCGNSDPGTSGLLTPYGKIKGAYFDDSPEKDNFMYEFQKDLSEILKKKGVQYIKLDFDSESDFYDAIMALQESNLDIKIYGTSKEGHCEVVVEDEIDNDDTESEASAASNMLKRKKKKKGNVDDLVYSEDLPDEDEFDDDDE